MQVNFVNDANLNLKSNKENIFDEKFKPDLFANSFIICKYENIL